MDVGSTCPPLEDVMLKLHGSVDYKGRKVVGDWFEFLDSELSFGLSSCGPVYLR